MKREEGQCDCRTAVMRTFGELQQRNMKHAAALESAVTVFRFHRPEIPEAEAKKTVDKWVAN
jgi:hypothetical protein